MKGSVVQYWLVLAALVAAIYGSFVMWRRTHDEQAPATAGHVEPPSVKTDKPPKLTDFVLTDENGQTFDSKSLKGQVWVGSFFFTNCPGACWRLNQALADLQRATPDSKVRYISITCDPENDPPAALLKYAQHFKADPARWTFLTGPFATIRQIGNDFFQVAVDKQTHSDRAFVVDRNGTVRGRFRLTEPDQVEMLKALIATVEAEPAKADEVPPADAPATETPAADKPSDPAPPTAPEVPAP